MARIENTIFISYRRTDVYTALAVYENLKNQGYDVFFDYRSISSGDFEQIITSNIRARAHFLLILTPTALDRCNEPGDWLRREIEFAIDEKRNIVPLFFKGFRFGNPSVSEKLTGKLKNLSRYNGLNIHEDYFDEAMQRLRIQYLNVPLDTVLHPVPTEVKRLVREEQVAADRALEHIVNVKDLLKQTSERPLPKRELPQPVVATAVKSETAGTMSRRNLLVLGGGLGIVLCIVAVAVLSSNFPPFRPQFTKTPEPTVTVPTENTATPEPPMTVPPENTTPSSPTANSDPFISSQVIVQSVPYEESNPGSNFPPFAPFEIKAQIPQLAGSDDLRVQSINQSLSNFVIEEISNYRQQFKGEFTASSGKSDLEVTYTLVSRVGDYWSFRFDFSFYVAGAASGHVSSRSLYYDLSQGKQLALSDLFIPNSNYLDLISNYCSNQIRNELGDAFSPEGAAPTLENYKNWTVTIDGILITFEQYQVGPGAAGNPAVEVPYDELNSVIQPDGPLKFLVARFQ
jgi:hypothetical protein